MAESRIPLSTLIAELRRELAEAQQQGQGQFPRLRVDEAEIEVQVVITRGNKDGMGVKFWVFNAEMKNEDSDAVTQKIKLKLKPSDVGDKEFDMAAEQKPKGASSGS